MDEFRYTLSRQLHKQSPMQLLGAEQVAELVPILNMDNIHGGLFTPNEGHIDPYRYPDKYLHISTLPPQPHHGHRARRPGPGRGARAELRRERAAAARGRRLGRGDGARHGAGQPGHQLRRGVLSCFPPIINLYPSQWLKHDSLKYVRGKHPSLQTGFHGREVGLLAGLELPLVPVQHQVSCDWWMSCHVTSIIISDWPVPGHQVRARRAAAEAGDTRAPPPGGLLLLAPGEL